MEASCALVYDSLTNFSMPSGYGPKTIAWMDGSGAKTPRLDGSLRADLESVGVFARSWQRGWFMKKTPAEHAFSRLNALGEEIDWLKFEDIAIDPSPSRARRSMRQIL